VSEKGENEIGPVVAECKPYADGENDLDQASTQLLEMRRERHRKVGMRPHSSGCFGGSVDGVATLGFVGELVASARTLRYSSSSMFWAFLNSSEMSPVARRNSARPFPRVRATSGMRLGPRTMSATTMITRSSGRPIPNMGEKGHCDRHAVAPKSWARLESTLVQLPRGVNKTGPIAREKGSPAATGVPSDGSREEAG